MTLCNARISAELSSSYALKAIHGGWHANRIFEYETLYAQKEDCQNTFYSFHMI